MTFQNVILKCQHWPPNLQNKFAILGHAEFNRAIIISVTYTHFRGVIMILNECCQILFFLNRCIYIYLDF